MKLEMIQDYLDLRFALCAIPPGSKAPKMHGWQTASASIQHWIDNPDDNVGLIHGLSGTCCLDIDHMDHCRVALASIGIDMDALFHGGVQIISREGRGKLLYRHAPDLPQRRHALAWCGTSILELRAGACQDVLPPSIHPDTGNPYTWVGDFENLPMLPEALARLWIDWDIAKPIMLEADPNYQAPVTPPAPRRVYTYSGKPGVIDAFNDANHPVEILIRHNYKQVGARLLSPHSKTKLPGITLLDDSTIFCHHASDPLCDGHAHDAFSLYCQLEHRGNVTNAVKQAAEVLGIVRAEDAEASAMVKQFLAGCLRHDHEDDETPLSIPPPVRQKQERETVPDPGPPPTAAAALVCGWLVDNLHYCKRDAIIQTACSFLCMMASRRYVTPSQQGLGVFLGTFDTSAAGLTPLKSAVFRLADYLDERKSIRGTRISSTHRLYKAFLRHPRLYWATDEYANLLRIAKKQTTGEYDGVLSILHECYHSRCLYLDPDTAQTGSKEMNPHQAKVVNPAVTMMLVLSHADLAHLAEPSEYARGGMQQIMLAPAGAMYRHEATFPAPCDDLIKAAKALTHREGNLAVILEENHAQAPHLRRVAMSAEVSEHFDLALETMRDWMKTDERQQYRGCAIGYHQTALRIASALAAWENPKAPEIRMEEARWASDWALRCLVLSVSQMAVSADQEKENDVMQRILALLANSEEPLTSRSMVHRCRPYKRLPNDERKALLAQMVEDGEIISVDGGYTLAKKTG